MIIPWLNQTLITISSAANLTYFILILVFCIPKYLILIIILVLIQFKWETDTNINIFFWSLFLKCVRQTFNNIFYDTDFTFINIMRSSLNFADAISAFLVTSFKSFSIVSL